MSSNDEAYRIRLQSTSEDMLKFLKKISKRKDCPIDVRAMAKGLVDSVEDDYLPF